MGDRYVQCLLIKDDNGFGLFPNYQDGSLWKLDIHNGVGNFKVIGNRFDDNDKLKDWLDRKDEWFKRRIRNKKVTIMAKLFYVKFDVSAGTLILDQSRVKQSYDELLVNNFKITKAQAKLLKDAITDRFLYKDRAAFLSEVEWEFNRLFHVCSSCNFVTDKSKVK